MNRKRKEISRNYTNSVFREFAPDAVRTRTFPLLDKAEGFLYSGFGKKACALNLRYNLFDSFTNLESDRSKPFTFLLLFCVPTTDLRPFQAAHQLPFLSSPSTLF